MLSSDTKDFSVIIIGGGFSGAALALQVLSAGSSAPHVTLVDRSGRFGPGLAYSTSDPAHLLNVRCERLSLDPKRPSNFSEWLQETDSIAAPSTVFASRAAYGAYLEAQVRRAARAFPGALTLVRDSAVSCHTDSDGVSVALASGKRLNADVTVLALGNPPSNPPAQLAGAPVIEPWDQSALARIRPCENVLLVGSGLTMVDVALSLSSTPRSGKMLALSRRGLTPHAHTTRHANPAEPLALLPPLSNALSALRREIEAANAQGEPWQGVLDRLRPQTNALWRQLTLIEKMRFLRHLKPWWNSARHRSPPHIASWVQALQNAGALQVAAGTLLKVDVRGKRKLSVSFRPRGSKTPQSFEAAHIINCTGPGDAISAAREPLVRQILEDGLVRVHPTRLGLDADENGRLLNTHGEAQPRLFALGPILQGVLWETTAIAEIRDQAQSLARALLALQAASGVYQGNAYVV